MMPTCAFSTYRPAQLVIDQAESLAPSPPLPCLSLLYLSASSFCLSFAFWARQVLPLFDSHPLVVRLVTSSSPACLVPCASRVDLLFPLATTNIARAPGSSSVHRATSIATFCLCSRCHAQYSPRQLTKVVHKKQKG